MKLREWLLIFVELVSAGAYVFSSSARGAIGFPLDDAWIHQVYARNLGTRGEFAFFAGQPSAGSTSPFWAILLSVGYLLRIDFRVWTFLLGALFIGLSAIFCARLAKRISGSSQITVYCLLFTIFEWHLAWSAVSGMEIPLFVFLSILLLERFFAERTWALGLIAGLLTLTRPEGVVLGALVGLHVIVSREAAKQSPRVSLEIASSRTLAAPAKAGETLLAMTLYALGFAIVIAPYLAFNLATSGSIFPNTFYAKNAEYAVLLERAPFYVRWLQLSVQPWIGAQILLLPGFVFIIAQLTIKRDWRALIPFAWIMLLPVLYALRLPVMYQHGRYEMPLVPFIALYGIWGTTALFARIINFVVRAAWGVSTATVLIAFWVLGANAYAKDVAIIDCEMVQTARWVSANVPRDAVLAAHDIGALGYLYERPFIDLAGLVSPEVIPFIRDESRLRDFLFSRQTAFVIAFPDWYDSLTRDPRFVRVHQENCAVTRAEGGTDMVVYEIR